MIYFLKFNSDKNFFFIKKIPSKINKSTMDNKIKRVEKVLKRKYLKGLLKLGDNLEKSHFVIVENPRCVYNSMLIKTEDYKILLERGETYPTDSVHFLILTNKRNIQNIKKSLLTPKQMSLFSVY